MGISTTLRIKSSLIGTPLEPLALAVRKIAAFPGRICHPELSNIYAEPDYLMPLLQRVLRKNSNCVDCGCHLGSVLNLFIRLAPKGRHVAFEPVPEKCALLVRKFPNVSVHQVALSDTCGTARFEEDTKRSGYSRLSESPEADKKSYSVKTVRLDDVITNPVDFIKLDLEGGELAALKGAERILRERHPTILFECVSEYGLKQQKIERIDIYDLLHEYGYNIRTMRGYVKNEYPLTFDQFRQCGIYPFQAFNFVGSKQ